MKRGLSLVLLLLVALLSFASCVAANDHDHTYSDVWETDENNHWHKATCEHTDAIASKGAHKDADNNGECDICGYGDAHVHTYTDAWSSDAEGHWHAGTCEGESVKGQVYPHATKDGDIYCDLCGYEVAYQITVNAPKYVTIGGSTVAYPGEDVTFTASASTNFTLAIEGATQVGEPVKEDGVITYTYKVEDLAAHGEATITATRYGFTTEYASDEIEIEVEEIDGWMTGGEAEFTVTIPAAGKYVLIGSVGHEMSLNFYNADGEWLGAAFDIEEAGEITVTAKVAVYTTGLELEAVDVTYYLISVEETELNLGDKLVGDGYTFPAGVEMEVTFVAPEAGLYQITSPVEGLLFNNDLNICVAYATEAGEEITVYVKQETFEASSYEFIWNIEKLAPTADAIVGENDVTIPYGKYLVLKLVAENAGDYTFAMESGISGVYAYDTEYGFMMSLWDVLTLDEGEELILYICNTDDESFDGEDTVADVLTITYSEPAPGIDVTVTDTYGFFDEYSFTAEVSGTYTFAVPAGLGVLDLNAGPWDPPYVDFNFNEFGTTFDLVLAAGEVFAFAVGSFETGEFRITYSVVEGEVGGGDDEGGDDPVPSIKDANGLGGTYEFTFNPVTFTLTFTPDSEGATTGTLEVIDPATASNGGTFTYTISDGAYVFYQDGDETLNVIVTNDGHNWLFQNLSLRFPQAFAAYEA